MAENSYRLPTWPGAVFGAGARSSAQAMCPASSPDRARRLRRATRHDGEFLDGGEGRFPGVRFGDLARPPRACTEVRAAPGDLGPGAAPSLGWIRGARHPVGRRRGGRGHANDGAKDARRARNGSQCRQRRSSRTGDPCVDRAARQGNLVAPPRRRRLGCTRALFGGRAHRCGPKRRRPTRILFGADRGPAAPPYASSAPPCARVELGGPPRAGRRCRGRTYGQVGTARRTPPTSPLASTSRAPVPCRCPRRRHLQGAHGPLPGE